MVPQPALVALLAGHVARLGVPVHRGVEVTGLADTGDGVLLDTSTTHPVRTGWVVGCDGGHSAVRRLAVADPAVVEGPSGVLVRPDGVVAWASDTGDAAGLEAALRRMFDLPAAAGVPIAVGHREEYP